MHDSQLLTTPICRKKELRPGEAKNRHLKVAELGFKLGFLAPKAHPATLYLLFLCNISCMDPLLLPPSHWVSLGTGLLTLRLSSFPPALFFFF